MQSAAATYWSTHTGYAMNWFQFCAPYINERVTGDANLPPTLWALSRAGKAKHLLEIGCLDGRKIAAKLERGLIERGSGVDIAADAITRGRAAYPQIDLSVCDLNAPNLPAETYDVIVANGVLHHIESIDACVEALYGALMPGGWLFASEFTGPRRYEYTDEEVAAIHAGQAMLPEALQGEPFAPEMLAPKLRADPSESVSTDIIEPTLRRVFDEVTAIPFGGNVLQRALTKDFFDGFDGENAAHIAALERLIAFDKKMSARSTSSHHCYFIARKL